VGGTNPKPPQRFGKQAFLHWAAKVKNQAREVHAVYEACGLGFSLQRQLSALGIECYVVCPQKLDEQNRRVKLVKVRKVLEAQGRSLMVNHGIEPVQEWWKRRVFATLAVRNGSKSCWVTASLLCSRCSRRSTS